MGKRISMFSLVVLLVVSALSQNIVAQITHTIGDSTGWRIPSDGAATYNTWTSQHTFFVGDVLVFNFVDGMHDVTEVTKASFDNCAASNPISTTTTAPAIIPLSYAGQHFLICTFSGHCDAGQKLSVNVSSSSIATPPTSTTSPPPPLPTNITTLQPPHRSSGPSFPAMSLPVALFSAVVVFVY